MEKSYGSKWQCSRPRVMGADREERGQALTGVRVGQVLSHEKVRPLSREGFNPASTLSDWAEDSTSTTRDATGWRQAGGVVDPVHARKAPHAGIGRAPNRPRGIVVRTGNPKGVLRS